MEHLKDPSQIGLLARITRFTQHIISEKKEKTKQANIIRHAKTSAREVKFNRGKKLNKIMDFLNNTVVLRLL